VILEAFIKVILEVRVLDFLREPNNILIPIYTTTTLYKLAIK